MYEFPASLRALVSLSLTLVALLSLSCEQVPGAADRVVRSAGSAVLVTSESHQVTSEALRRLETAGVGEVFARMGTLSWQGDEPKFERATGIDLPRRTVTTLSLAGEYPDGGDPNARALRLADELLQLKLDAETRGLELRGFHLDLVARQPIGYGEFLDQLRRKLSREMQLSIRLPESWLNHDEIREVVGALGSVDFVVLRIYGQPLGQTSDRPSRWEIRTGADRIEQALELGAPVMAEVLIKGYVARRSAEGEEVERAAGINLEPLLTNRAFKAEPIFELAGFDRQVFDILAERSGRLGGLRVRAGEKLRIVRPTAGHLAKLRSEMARRSLEGYLGEIYHSWPSRREVLSIQPGALADAVSGATVPELAIEVNRETASGIWSFRFDLENRGLHPTAMALVDTNFLEVQLEGGSFGKVELGDFHRYELGRIGEESAGIQQVRNANRLRLYFPMLDPGWRIATGQIQIVTRGEPMVRAGAVYLLPDGDRIELAQAEWQTLLPAQDEAEDAEEVDAPGDDRNDTEDVTTAGEVS